MATKKTAKKTNTSKKTTAKAAAKAPKTTAVDSTADKVTVSVAAKATTPAAKLAKWNKLFALFFGLQAAIVAWLGNATSATVTTQYLTVDPLATDVAGQQVLATASRHLLDVRLSWVVVAFLALLALWHLALATVYRKRYETEVAGGVSRARWLGLGLGGAIMVLAIALLSGVHAAALLLFMSGAVLVGAGLTDATLRLKQAADRPLAHAMCIAATVVSLAPWAVLASNVCGALRYGGTIPMYLYAIYIVQVLLVGALILAMHWRIRRTGRWADHYYTERALMILGFTAASLLTWQLFAGVLYP